MVFIPTYLYIKQHTITGKLYFGKCTRPLNEMLKYTGSGSRWKKHYQKHGRQYIITLWYELYDNPFDLVADALSMSKSFDIVNNNSWMNLINENGLDGYPSGINLNMIVAKNPLTGEVFSVLNTDPRWVSGELVGINKGVPMPKSMKDYCSSRIGSMNAGYGNSRPDLVLNNKDPILKKKRLESFTKTTLNRMSIRYGFKDKEECYNYFYNVTLDIQKLRPIKFNSIVELKYCQDFPSYCKKIKNLRQSLLLLLNFMKIDRPRYK